MLYRHKGDAGGSSKNRMKHLKANPTNPFICSHLALIVKIISNDHFEDNLWDSNTEEVNFGRHLNEELDNLSENALLSMGLSDKKIGTHSIRKGANSFGLSFPEQTAPIPMFLHGGWKIGANEKQYCYQTVGGSQNVATMLSGLNPLTSEFATLPMRFNKNATIPLESILQDYNSYPMKIRELIQNLLPSLVFHIDFLRLNLESTHPFFHSRFWVDKWYEKLQAHLLPMGIMYCNVTGMKSTGIPSITRVITAFNDLKNEFHDLKSVILNGKDHRHLEVDTLISRNNIQDESGIETANGVNSTMLEVILQKVTELSARSCENGNNSSNNAHEVNISRQWRSILKLPDNLVLPPSDFKWPSKITVSSIHNLWYMTGNEASAYKFILPASAAEKKRKSMAKTVVEFIDKYFPVNYHSLSISERDAIFSKTLEKLKIDKQNSYTSEYGKITEKKREIL